MAFIILWMVLGITEYPRFSDFADEVQSFEGEKKKIEDILGKEILVLDFNLKDSKHHCGSKYITIQFELCGVTYIVFTGSQVLIEQLNKYEGNIPFHTVIKKVGKYYTLS